MEEERIKVLTLLMWLQTAIYSADECQEIKWFNTKRSKQLLKATVDTILKEHGKVFVALWDTDGVQMPQVTKALEEFTKLLATTDYYKLPEISALIRAYQAGEFEETFNPIRNEQ
jgi:hypothetical protein